MVHHMTWYVLYGMVTLLGAIVLYTLLVHGMVVCILPVALCTVYCTGHLVHIHMTVCCTYGMSMYTHMVYLYMRCVYTICIHMVIPYTRTYRPIGTYHDMVVPNGRCTCTPHILHTTSGGTIRM